MQLQVPLGRGLKVPGLDADTEAAKEVTQSSVSGGSRTRTQERVVNLLFDFDVLLLVNLHLLHQLVCLGVLPAWQIQEVQI